MNDDDFLAIERFFKQLDRNFGRTGSKRRINKTKSRGFGNENINILKNKFTTDLMRDASTGEITGSNKKKNKFDKSRHFNPLYLIDE